MKLLFQRGNCLARLADGVLYLFIDITALCAGLHCAVADFFQLGHALPDLVLALALFGHLDSVIGFLLQFAQASAQALRHIAAYFAHLGSGVDALLHLGKTVSELI